MTKSSLVIVYHRQPYEEVDVDGKIEFRENKSPNGVVPALKGFFGSVDKGCWIAWKQSEQEGVANFDQRIEIDDSFGQYEVFRIPMTAKQVKSFYHITSKEALWPILHSFPWMFNYDAVDWETFRQVNKQ
ncbi:MAG: trehalose-6-phosphate synthase, partial [Pseudomonadota bacterium]